MWVVALLTSPPPTLFKSQPQYTSPNCPPETCLLAFQKSTVFPCSPMLVLSSCFWILPLESVQSLLGLFYFTPWVCRVHGLAPPTALTPFCTLAQSCAQLQLQGSPRISSKVSCLHTIFAHATSSSWKLSPQALPGRLLLFPQLCTWLSISLSGMPSVFPTWRSDMHEAPIKVPLSWNLTHYVIYLLRYYLHN